MSEKTDATKVVKNNLLPIATQGAGLIITASAIGIGLKSISKLLDDIDEPKEEKNK